MLPTTSGLIMCCQIDHSNVTKYISMNDTIERKDLTVIENLRNELFSIIPGIRQASAVPVIDARDLKEEVFREQWVARNRPCLVKGAVRHWPAVEKWKDKQYWLSMCDNFDVTVYPHQNHVDRVRNKGEDMLFHDAVERLFRRQDIVFSIPAEQIVEGKRFFRILKDVKGFRFLSSPKKPLIYDQRRFFIYRRAATAWHYHSTDETLMCQVNGSKRVALLSPEIPNAKHVTDFLHRELYLDGKTMDASLDLKPFIVDVEEGDALYIPPFWHHGVVPNDDEVGFTLAYCWKSPWHKYGRFANYFVRQLYKDGLWPLKPVSVALPFIGLYAGACNLVQGVKNVVRGKH